MSRERCVEPVVEVFLQRPVLLSTLTQRERGQVGRRLSLPNGMRRTVELGLA